MREALRAIVLIVSCCVLSAQAVQYKEQQLMTLFNTEAERQAINAARRGEQQQRPREVETPLGPTNIHINGIVSRSGGKSVVWANGRSTLKNSMVDGVKIYSDKMKSNHIIPVMIDGRMVYIKPGESWSQKADTEDDDL